MGVYSSSQFFGAFMGGLLAGWLMSRSVDWVFYALLILMFLMAVVGKKIVSNRVV